MRFLLGVLISLVTGSASLVGQAMQLKVDHTPICGSDLAAMQAAFASVGLGADYGGPHATGGTHMAVLGFADGSYIELIAQQRPGSVDNSWKHFVESDAGPCSWAVLSADVQKDVARMKAAGLPTYGPFEGGRKKPDGNVLQWRTAAAGTSLTPGATLPFMIEDITPREWRVQPSASTKLMGLNSIALVVLGVRDLEAGIALFRKAYGWPAPAIEDHPEFEARLAHFAGTPVILATPSGKDSWLAKRLEQFGEAPVAFLLGAEDLSKSAAQVTPATTPWFGQRVAWFDAAKLRGVRLGVVKAGRF